MRALRTVCFLFGLSIVGLGLLFGVVRDRLSAVSWIVYVRHDRLGSHLYLMDSEGGQVRRLTQGAENEWLPTWSPDGAWVAFVTNVNPPNMAPNFELFKIRADGIGLRRLTTANSYEDVPEWSPDGEWIAFISDRNGENAIYKMRPDGSGVRRITPRGISAMWLTWSPDSEWLMFSASLSDVELYRIRADGTDMQLVEYQDQDSRLDQPRWSPNGQSIVVTDLATGDFVIIAVDGTELSRIPAHGVINEPPTWSPDGEWLVYAASNELGDFDLYKVRRDGQDLQQLTTTTNHETQPDWGPAIDLAWSGWLLGVSSAGIGSLGAISGVVSRHRGRA